MARSNKKIALIVAGGTTLAEKNYLKVERESDLEKWIAEIPELSIMAEVEPLFLCGEDHQVGIDLWQNLSRLIFDNLGKYQGFIVTSPMEEILINSLAVSFAIKNLNKPVVFTSSQLGRDNKPIGLGIKAHLIDALQVATMDLPAVGLMLSNKYIRAVRATESSDPAVGPFSCPDESFLAKVDFGVSLSDRIRPPKGEPFLANNFGRVLLFKYYPGLSFEKFDARAFDGLMVNALAGRAFDERLAGELSGLARPALAFHPSWLEEIKKENILTITGITKMTALVKFMWALGQTKEPQKLQKIMQEDICQEFLA